MSTAFLESLFSLAGRVAIVTGASRGIGAAIAGGFAAAGADVTGLARSPSRELPPPADGFVYVSCDITDTDTFAATCRKVYEGCGRLDVLVNAAGITLPAAEPEQSLADFDATLSTNLRAAYACARAAIDFMTQSGGGSIINVTSIGGMLGFPGNPGYAAAKGGLRVLTKALAVDYAARNIRVNNLVPGYVRTRMTEASYNDNGAREKRRRRTILNRWGKPGDLVGAAIFLASPASAYVTGQDLIVDGGWTAKGLD